MSARGKRNGARVDFAEVRARLAASLDAPSTPSASAESTLKARAERLATPIATEASREVTLSALYFERAGRRYAIEARFVVEVQHAGRVSRVPRAQAALIGVTNLRGDVLPVFDLAVLEGNRAATPEHPELVVLGEAQPDLALLVDGECDVVQLLPSALEEPRALGDLPHARFVRGVSADARLFLDGRAVLRDRKIFVARPGSSEPVERMES